MTWPDDLARPRWTPPPGWPAPPPGWSPPPGWRPDPSWPPPPPGWVWWQDGLGRPVGPSRPVPEARQVGSSLRRWGPGLLAAAALLAVAVTASGPDEARLAADTAPSRSAGPATGSSTPPSASPAVPPAATEVEDGADVPSGAAPADAVPPAPGPAAAGLLTAAPGGDGDSWKDTSGASYRLGLVNAPEQGECFGAEATAERRRLVAGGFRADVYATDRYGRRVAVVTTADGLDVNVDLARRGFVDDRFLEEFRHENPALARRLDAAFAEARSTGAGLWSACRRAAPEPAAPPPPPPPPPPAAAPPPAPASACHPDYVTCLPVQGDGSGNGAANDLDCGDIRQRVQLRVVGVDPYRLDRQGDGFGCESYG